MPSVLRPWHSKQGQTSPNDPSPNVGVGGRFLGLLFWLTSIVIAVVVIGILVANPCSKAWQPA